ncbi:MAG: hypothetical protein ACRD3T_02000 [Terriglobia bacterium]
MENHAMVHSFARPSRLVQTFADAKIWCLSDTPVKGRNASERRSSALQSEWKSQIPKGLFKQTHKSLKTLLNYWKNQSKPKKQTHRYVNKAFIMSNLWIFLERIQASNERQKG